MSAAKSRGRTAGLILLTLAAGSILSWTLITRMGQGQPNAESTANGERAIGQAESLSRAFRAAAAQVRPTVVKITTTSKPVSSLQRRGRPDDPLGAPFPFGDLFGDDVPGFRWFEVPSAPRAGLGSGVIIDPSGVVLTNNHVVAGADEVTVQLGDGSEFEVKEVRTDKRTDLAVLILDADRSLPAARLGDSDRLETGDWVLAIGNPFGLEQTVSAGIISGKGRSLASPGLNRVERTRARFLQTDAAINPGNSGGPLVNLRGEVVGINTAIFSETGAYQGVGFAIPSNLAKWVAPQLIKQGEVARAYLGVIIENIDAQKGKELNLAPGSGVTVKLVGEGSPAEQAGLKEGDVILSFDGRKIASAGDLQQSVERSAASSRHQLRIQRDGKTQALQVVLQQMRPDFEQAMTKPDLAPPLARAGVHQDRQLGLIVSDLTDELAKEAGYEKGSGVVIEQVGGDGIAAQAGLRRGMLITRVGTQAVKSVAEFAEAMKSESLARGVTLELRAGRSTRTVTLQRSP